LDIVVVFIGGLLWFISIGYRACNHSIYSFVNPHADDDSTHAYPYGSTLSNGNVGTNINARTIRLPETT